MSEKDLLKLLDLNNKTLSISVDDEYAQLMIRKEIEKYVYSLSKQELREQLLWRMLDERSHRNYW